MNWKRAVCGLLLAGLLLTPARAARYSDTDGHWAEPSIIRWSDRGVVVGNNGAFYPDNALTRAELAVILDRIFGWQTAAENVFADLDGGTWYADAILRANAAGVLLGDGEKVYPGKNVTRQEAAVMLSRALRVSGSDTATNFGDREEIAAWAVSAVNGMTQLGFFQGGDDGDFDPLGGMTRAQTVTVLDRAIANYYNAAGNYSGSVSGITVVAAPGVTLQSMTVDGDLIVAPGARVGEVILSDVTVTGQTYIQTDSSADVILSGGSLGRVTVEGVGARVIVRGDTEFEALTVSGDGVSLRGLPEDMSVMVDKDAGGVTVNGHAVSSGAVTAGKDVSTDEEDVTIEITFGGGSSAENNANAGGNAGSGGGSSVENNANAGGGAGSGGGSSTENNANAGDDGAAKDDTGGDDTSKDETGKDETGKDDTGGDDTAKDETGGDDTGKDDTGGDDTAKDDTGNNTDTNTGSNAGTEGDNAAENTDDAGTDAGWYYINENGELVIDVSRMPK